MPARASVIGDRADMELHFGAEAERFRQEVRSWLMQNVPTGQPSTPAERRSQSLAWQRAQFEAGWAGVAWPREVGGRGLSLLEQLIWFEEYARAGAPSLIRDPLFVGISHAGPTLILKGSAEQKAFHLPKILRGEVIWSQGFSEPQAGSDLASLRCRGVVAGDELMVSGQKIWTSSGNLSDYQELLVRTDPSAPKHKGITWVICDMKTPGITIRPIKTMDGNAEFCEVFYDQVRIPLSNVVGGLNAGWGVAMATLSFERGSASIADATELVTRADALIQLCMRSRRADLLRRAALLKAQSMSVRAMIYRLVSANMKSERSGPESSMIRLRYSKLLQGVHRLAMEALGNGVLSRQGVETAWVRDYLYSYSQTIGGGTEQIQRNIIGERILGLPRSAGA
jgi:alkylation response protein AidB-like acyl-CoA dehydrogenase